MGISADQGRDPVALGRPSIAPVSGSLTERRKPCLCLFGTASACARRPFVKGACRWRPRRLCSLRPSEYIVEVTAMFEVKSRGPAVEPEDLGRMFLERASAGDVEGVVALYEPEAVLESPPGRVAIGVAAMRLVYQVLLADKPQFSGDVRPALQYEDLALTSTRFQGGATAEVARRQDDGTWLWIVDQPNIVGERSCTVTANGAARATTRAVGRCLFGMHPQPSLAKNVP
jgi:SnoaL-like domain